LEAIATERFGLRQVDRARMDNGACDAIEMLGSILVEILLAMMVEMVRVNKIRERPLGSWRGHRESRRRGDGKARE
jgi:hypothetical protein